MFISNQSSYPDAEVFRLVRYAFRGIRTTELGIQVKAARRGSSVHGYTHPRVPRTAPMAWHKSVTRFVMLAIGPPSAFPADNLILTNTKKRTVPLAKDRESWDALIASLGEDERVWRVDYARQKVTIVTQKMIPYGGQKSPLIEQRDWQEGLIALAAHEARHVWQFLRNDKERAAGISKKLRSGFGEAEAERYALMVLENFRRERDDVLEGPCRAVAHRPTGQRGSTVYSLMRRLAPHKEQV